MSPTASRHQERRRALRVSPRAMGLSLGAQGRELPVREMSINGLSVYHLRSDVFAPGQEVELHLLQESSEIVRQLKARVVRVDGEVAGLEYTCLPHDQGCRLYEVVLRALNESYLISSLLTQTSH